MDQSDLSGFDPHVRDQLSQLSLNQRQPMQPHAQSGNYQQSSQRRYTTQVHPRNPYHPHPRHHTPQMSSYHSSQQTSPYQSPPQMSPYQPPQQPPDMGAFPPLGPNSAAGLIQHPPTSSFDGHARASRSAAEEFFNRTRGRGNRQAYRRQHQIQTDDFSRPTPTQPRLYHARAHSRYGGYDQSSRHRTMEQADFLECTVRDNHRNMLTAAEIGEKQKFSRKIEGYVRQVVQQQMPNSVVASASNVKLQPYGSLVNSFGLTGCDIDLLLTVERSDRSYVDITDEVKRELEKVLLDNGFGARLLANTRVPILQVCEKPSPQLLSAFRESRERWEMEQQQERQQQPQAEDGAPPKDDFGPLPPHLNIAESNERLHAIQSLTLDAAAIPLPGSPVAENARVEFSGDCGFQCDINFTGHVALHNTRMLWTYGQLDQRVRIMGVFVKNWAKARDINTPYRGTLSSYGYILMVLHYCINVARPPVLPNLQELGRGNGWSEAPFELFQGFDVRFEHDLVRIRNQFPAYDQRNNTSLGGLLRGFFQYYGTAGGFRWTEEVISIRTPGGILSKQEKGWVKAKWSEDNANVRQRYLFAIEDPFETTHNVGRTVGHNGIVAIRDEFRRAWKIIDGIQAQGSSWMWASRDGSEQGQGSDLLARDADHGDTLRKDADARKVRLMREKLEAQEALTRAEALHDREDANEEWEQDTGMLSDEESFLNTQPPDNPAMLIHDVQRQDEKVARMRSRLPERERRDNNEDPDQWPSFVEKMPDYENNDAYDASEKLQGTEDGNEPLHSDNAGEQEKGTQSQNDENTWAEDQTQIPQNVPTYRTAVGTSWAPDAVGEVIPWTTNSKAGLWLLQRDKAIREGDWNPPTTGTKGRLHAMFPYNPNMTREELAKLNAKLETYYKHSLHSAKSTDMKQLGPEEDKVPISVSEEIPLNGWTSGQTLASTATHERPLRDWPVGSDIPWSLETEAGQWLAWRDRKIRDGTWAGPRTRYGGLSSKLDALFPYTTDQTFANLERYNAELDRFFWELKYPRKEMDPRKRKNCARAMQNAIEQTLAYRHTDPEVYQGPSHPTNGAGSVQSDHTLLHNNTTMTVPPVVKPPSTQDKPAKAQWTLQNDVGSWLQWRDSMIESGVWYGQLSEGSIFCQLHKLYPYSPSPSVPDRERQNREIEKYFNGVFLPQPGLGSAEPAYRAILKVVESRKDGAENRRIQGLLSLFQKDTLKSLSETHSEPALIRAESKHEMHERSMQAVMALSAQLKTPGHHPECQSSLDEIRRRRLAYFDPKQAPADVGEGEQSKTQMLRNISAGRDSTAGDSCSEQLTETSLDDSSPLHEPPTNFEQPEDARFPRVARGDPFEASKDQYEPATTDEAAGEVIPKTLCPETWRMNRKHRHEDPRIMPFPRTLDFPFDKRQLADIDTIRQGGNGCVRGGTCPYQLETDQYSWGGGGAMAQRTASFHWSHGHMFDSESEVQRKDAENLALFNELPRASDG